MFGAILSFLGGAGFRMLWGDFIAWFNQAREHRREIERLRLQGELDAAAHERNLAAIRLQHELGVETIRVQGQVQVDAIEAQAFAISQAEGMKPTGIFLVDAWNACIRPAAATLCLWLWFRSLYIANWAMQGRDWDMVCAILGWFFADRHMAKRGK